MKTRRLVELVAVTLVVLCVPASFAHAQTLEEIFESVLNQAIEAPLPGAICPLIRAAEYADTIAVAALEIAVAEREQQILGEYIATTDQNRQVQLERQKKACAQIKSELIRIKNRRTARTQKVREAKEGGRSFAFHGRFEISPFSLMKTTVIITPG